jgi:hypothetical protein
MFQAKAVEKLKTRVVFNNSILKIVLFRRESRKIWWSQIGHI